MPFSSVQRVVTFSTQGLNVADTVIIMDSILVVYSKFPTKFFQLFVLRFTANLTLEVVRLSYLVIELSDCFIVTISTMNIVRVVDTSKSVVHFERPFFVQTATRLCPAVSKTTALNYSCLIATILTKITVVVSFF